MARYSGYTRLEKRSGCRGLAVRPVVAEPREHVPEVRRDDGKAREQGGLGEGAGRKAAPSPPVLHLVEDVLAVAAPAVEGEDVPRVHVEVRDEGVPLVAVRAGPVRRLHELQAGDAELRELPRRRALPPLRHRLDRTPREDHAPGPTPGVEPDFPLRALPPPGRAVPRPRLRERGEELAAYPLRPPRLEEVPHVSRLAVAYHGVVTEGDVAPYEARLPHGRDEREILRQHGAQVRPGRFVAGMHDDRERQPELRDAQRVVAVGRTARLLRAVARLRPLLAPAGRLHGRVEVEDVVLRDHVLQEAQVLASDPRQRLFRRDGREVPPHRVARHEPPDAEQLRGGRVAAQAVEVPEPRRPVDHGHHDGHNQVPHLRRVVARR